MGLAIDMVHIILRAVPFVICISSSGGTVARLTLMAASLTAHGERGRESHGCGAMRGRGARGAAAQRADAVSLHSF